MAEAGGKGLDPRLDDGMKSIAARMGEDLFALRRQEEDDRIAEACQFVSPKFTYLKFHVIRPFEFFLLKLFGLYRVGQRNFRDIHVVENTVRIDGLARELEGFTLMHLSDLHIDLDPSLADAIASAAGAVKCDACVMTGDYKNYTVGDPSEALAILEKLRGALPSPCFAVLGNHDTLDMVIPLEDAGYRVLLNESALLRRGSASVLIAGVDDPYIYQTHSIERAIAGAPKCDAKVLLAHSPVIRAEADKAGFDLMLCGHTHGGQVCLPGGHAILNNDRSPRRFISGRWKSGRLQGYTSRGTGGCGLPVRFFCPPEITLHRFVG